MIIFSQSFIVFLAIAVGFGLWCIDYIRTGQVARYIATGIVALLAIIALILMFVH
jgi:hypothetical protein